MSKNKQKHGNLCVCYSCKYPSNNKIDKEQKHTDSCPCIKCKKGTTGDNYWDCHKGNVPIFEKDGVTILGGGYSRDAKPRDVDIVIDLADNVPSSWSNFIPNGWKSKSLAWGPTVLYLTIKDFNAPTRITKEFWVALWEDLKAQAPCKVLVLCQGGHGRTGLVVTCLMMAAEFEVGKDINPLRWLREHYCKKAVESQIQLEYVGEMWDIAYVKKPITSSYTSPYHSGGGYNDMYDSSGYNSSDDKCHNGCGSERGEVIFEESIQRLECIDCWRERTENKLQQIEDDGGAVVEEDKTKGGGIEEQLHRMTDTQYGLYDDGYPYSETEN